MQLFAFENLILLCLLLVPGFVVYRVYSLLTPINRLESDKLWIELFCYGLLNFFLWFWLVMPFYNDLKAGTVIYWKIALVCLLVCFVSPSILALVWYILRVRVFHSIFGLDHPTPKGWDFFLVNNGEFMVLLTLKNGSKIGGYFGGKSFASTYPLEPEIYLEEIWKVDENGVFIKPVVDSLGAVFNNKEWDVIEFMKVKREGQPNLKSDAAVEK